MTSYNRDDKVGPWAEEKLNCLQKYLGAYTIILRNQKRSKIENYYYIDAFAGQGVSEVRVTNEEAVSQQEMILDLPGYSPKTDEERQYINGSPLRALEIENPFTAYLFVEANKERVERLQALVVKYSKSRKISIRQGDANEILINRVAKSKKICWARSRAVVFLDPFGMQVPWSTLQELASTGAIEVFINLPVGFALQRLFERHGKISDKRRVLLDQYFGTDKWWNVIYEIKNTMFDPQIKKVENSGAKLASWYTRRLEGIFGFAASPRLIKNSKGAHLYYLLFAGPNKTGAKIANYILRQGDRIILEHNHNRK